MRLLSSVILLQTLLLTACNTSPDSRRNQLDQRAFSKVIYIQDMDESTCKVSLREGEDVCLLLDRTVRMWRTSEGECSNITLQQVQTKVMRDLVTMPDALSKVILMDNIFTDCNLLSSKTCEKVQYRKFPVNKPALLHKLLEILSDNSLPEKTATTKFMDEYERLRIATSSLEGVMLFSAAYLHYPNNSIFVNRFGQSLQLIERDDLKSSLYDHAVKNGLWPNTLQRPEIDYTYGLTSHPWHNSSDFPFTKVLEENYLTFKQELYNNILMSNASMFGTESENLNSFSGGDWKALVIKSAAGFSPLSSYLPQTTRILKDIGEQFLLVKYSALKPGTRILPHTGPSNRRLRAHFCISHTGGASMRVGEEWRTWEEGKVLVLDSSFEHEVVHKGNDLRVVLILDIWHPELLSISNHQL